MDFHFSGRTKDSSNAREGAGNYHGLTPKHPPSETKLSAKCQVTSCPLYLQIITLVRKQGASFKRKLKMFHF